MKGGIEQCVSSEKAILMEKRWVIGDLYHATSGFSEGGYKTSAFGSDSSALLFF